MNKLIYSLVIFFLPLILFSQVSSSGGQSANRKDFVIQRHAIIDQTEYEERWTLNLLNMDKMVVGNLKYGEGLSEIKEEVSRRFPRKMTGSRAKGAVTFNADTPVVLRNFQGNAFNFGVPNDNTVAISNDGMLISAINSNLYIYDVDQDSLLKTMSLNAFADTLDTISSHQYDPRVLYDPDSDRFIFVHLAGASSDTLTNIIVGFSASSDPTAHWNMYKIPGDPLPLDTNWTDFPAIAVTNDELFITANLLRYGGTWQESFEQSVIWQIDKYSGYQGNQLDATMWHNIHYDGKPIRNLTPVPGGNHTFGPNMYFLSNRNFALQNDTFFLLELTGSQHDPSTQLEVQALTADFTYGAPPHAIQPFGRELQTNDARVLGAFYQEGMIQFVGNTVDTLNGFATIYHGKLFDLNAQPYIQGNILRDTLDYGYPEISYTGTDPGSHHAIITFNHTGPNTFPGSSAMFYEGNNNYSPRITLKEGSTVVNIMSGSDRWGDFTGSQPRFNHPGRVWVTTSFGHRVSAGIPSYFVQGTWVSELSSQLDDSTTAIFPSQAISGLKAYPNPAAQNDWVFIEFVLDQNQWTTMEVYDMQGRKIKRLRKQYMDAGKHQVSFRTEPLNQGMYLFVIRAGGKQIVSKKIVVN